MTYLEKKFDNTGLRKDYVAKKLDITERTLNRYLKFETIEHAMKFMELLHISGVHMCDALNIYYKTTRFECEDCKNNKKKAP